MSSSGRIPLLIIGGGIGGLATALAVARTGHPAHVLEGRPNSPSLARVSTCSERFAVLDQVGILEAVHKQAFFPRRL
jgi:salicylate hydroxylase